MTKEEIRKALKKQRDAIEPRIWTEKSNMINRTILESSIYKECDKLLIYADFSGEVGTLPVIDDAIIKGKHVYLPKVLQGFDDARMDFFRINSTVELINGYKGIMEPMDDPLSRFDYEKCKEEKLLMLVPGVAFDKDNNRMGYGMGYYDNYLKDKDKILKVAMAFDIQIIDNLPINSNDIKMDFIITESTSLDDINKLEFR